MKYLNVLRWPVLVLIVGAVAWQSAFDSAPLIAATNFFTRTPVFAMVQPPSRAQQTDRGVTLVQEPVYFDLRIPPRATTLSFALTVTSESTPFTLGVQKGEQWDFSYPATTITKQGDRQVYEFSIPTSELVLRSGYTARVLLSAPSLAPGHITLVGARAVFTR